jgi:hypothetical protein
LININQQNFYAIFATRRLIKKPEIRNIPEIAVAAISFPEPAILGKERNLLPEARNPG